MARDKSKVADRSQAELLDVTARLRTAPCVPALREAVKAWRAGKYKGIANTTRVLLNHWFYTDHKSRTGQPFKYHPSQQEAIETLIFVWEFEKVPKSSIPKTDYRAILIDTLPKLRNAFAHPRGHSIYLPGDALFALQFAAEFINRLFGIVSVTRTS